MRILVLGATGRTGAEILRQAAAIGHQVRARALVTALGGAADGAAGAPSRVLVRGPLHGCPGQLGCLIPENGPAEPATLS
ncbi:MAG: hypothetical protein ACRDPO_15715 [Streptosporangiaceae bacterium]